MDPQSQLACKTLAAIDLLSVQYLVCKLIGKCGSAMQTDYLRLEMESFVFI